jgi:hypothetical protein
MSRMFVLLVPLLLLAACGRSLEGTYADDVGFMSYTFHDDGRAVQSVLGLEVEMRYEREGDRIVVDGPFADMELVRIDERTLEGPDGMRLTRQD